MSMSRGQPVQQRRDRSAETATETVIWLWVLLLSPGIIFLPLMGLTIASITGPLRQMADRAHALMSQDYHGDIDIHPQLDLRWLGKVVVNPTPADLASTLLQVYTPA